MVQFILANKLDSDYKCASLPPPPPLFPPSYLMHKLDSVLEYGHEIGQAKVSHLLHHWIRVHLKTAVGGAQEVT